MEHYIEMIKQTVKAINKNIREDRLKLEATTEARQLEINRLEAIQWEMEKEIIDNKDKQISIV